MPTFQSRDDSVQLDANGETVIGFDGPIDQCQMTIQSPRSGADQGMIGGTCEVTGPSSVTLRLWRSSASPQYGTKPAAGERVLVSLLGCKN
jgi:hypothetical protein